MAPGVAGGAESAEPAGDVPAARGAVRRDGESARGQEPAVPGAGADGQVRVLGGGLQERRAAGSGGGPPGRGVPGLHAA